MLSSIACPFFRRAFGWCVPIGGLAGLIGLGGGEFRLPVLMHVIGFDTKSAVPLNLMTSFITLAFALITRSHALSPTDIAPYWPEICGLAAGGMFSAFHGARLVHALTNQRLVQIIAALLFGIGILLLVEAFAPVESLGLVPDEPTVRFIVGAVIGLLIGLVSSMLGVAGGELLIPTLVFAFGADVRTAGTASILLSLCIITVGLFRYWHIGALPKGSGVQRIAAAMSLGSIVGATIGGLAVAVAPTAFLKILLGTVLVAAAGKTWITRH